MNEHTMTEPANGFWFASVGGAATEVVRVHDGQMFSTGCQDGHSLDGVELIDRIENMPLPKREQKLQERRWRAQIDRAQAARYRRFSS